MKKIKVLLLLFLLTSYSFAAEIKDVSLLCQKEACQLVFQFVSPKNLPSFFQKYEASSKTLTVAFSETDFLLGEGSFDLSATSPLIQKMKVFKEKSKKTTLLKFEFSVGDLIKSDKNKIELSKQTDFVIVLPKAKDNGWVLTKKFKELKKAAEKAALEEKKRIAEEKKAAEKASLKEKKLAAQEKKSAEKAATAELKSSSESKPVSALIDGIQEMIALSSFGIEQFQLVTDDKIVLSNVGPLKKQVITIGLAGPSKSPVFKINRGSIVKSVYWNSYGLNLEIQPGIEPSILVRNGILILQTASEIKVDGIWYWHAKPNGIHERQWLGSKSSTTSFDAFVNKLEPESKKLVSVSQTFYLRPTTRELIVVSEEIELFASDRKSTRLNSSH